MTIKASTPEMNLAIEGALSRLGHSYQKSTAEDMNIYFVFIEDAEGAYDFGMEVGFQLVEQNRTKKTDG